MFLARTIKGGVMTDNAQNPWFSKNEARWAICIVILCLVIVLGPTLLNAAR